MPFLDKVGLQAFWTRIKNRYDSRLAGLESSVPGLGAEVAANKNAIIALQQNDGTHESDISVLEEKVEKLTPVTFTKTLATSWVNGEQTITDERIHDPLYSDGSISPSISASKDEKEAFYRAGIYLVSQVDGSATFGCFGDIPEISIPVTVKVINYG